MPAAGPLLTEMLWGYTTTCDKKNRQWDDVYCENGALLPDGASMGNQKNSFLYKAKMSDKGCDWTSGLREPCFECCRGHRHDVLAVPQEKFSDYVYEPIYIELFFKPVVIPTLDLFYDVYIVIMPRAFVCTLTFSIWCPAPTHDDYRSWLFKSGGDDEA